MPIRVVLNFPLICIAFIKCFVFLTIQHYLSRFTHLKLIDIKYYLTLLTHYKQLSWKRRKLVSAEEEAEDELQLQLLVKMFPSLQQRCHQFQILQLQLIKVNIKITYPSQPVPASFKIFLLLLILSCLCFACIMWVGCFMAFT